ncbi:uncharacterized protein EAF01_009376 [Botrytis porri]|uniref:uncharacterized protein n=1 Tax=Botrytis porri TaxID=87229 RepID=UPI0019010A24|nr:uncharacterized protein EAF01_009376 [Botrytis porri]KAF7896973.1 hypothetical protein EAF01_009376 [Botrytis porri]
MFKCPNYVGKNKQLPKISFISPKSALIVSIDADDKVLTRHDSGEMQAACLYGVRFGSFGVPLMPSIIH